MVLAVNAWDEDKNQLVRYVRKQKLKQRVLLNGSKVATIYGNPGVPTLLWIDGRGIVMSTEVGFGGAASLKHRTQQLLNGQRNE